MAGSDYRRGVKFWGRVAEMASIEGFDSTAFSMHPSSIRDTARVAGRIGHVSQ
jgi:hypothetical protein